MALLLSTGFIKVQGYVYSTIVNMLALATPSIIYLIVRRDVLTNMLKTLKYLRIRYTLPIALIVWITSSILTSIVDIYYPPPTWYIEKIRSLTPSNLNELLIALLMTWLLVAPVEELLFRWILLKPMVSLLGIRAGVLLSALIFTFSHLDPWNVISPFLVGLAAGWIIARDSSILSAIIIHGIHNTVTHIANMLIIF